MHAPNRHGPNQVAKKIELVAMHGSVQQIVHVRIPCKSNECLGAPDFINFGGGQMILALVQNEDRAQRLWPGIKAVAFLSESQEPFIPSGRYARQRFSRTKQCGNRIWPQIHPRVSGLNKEVVTLIAQGNDILAKHRISETSKARSRCGFARAWSTHKRNRVGPYRHRAGMEARDSTKA